MVEVRRYRHEDAAAVVALWWDSWHSIHSGLQHPEPLAKWHERWVGDILPKQEIAVADQEGTIVGFAAADTSAHELTQIFIDPNRKREGIGTELLAWAKRIMPDGFALYTLTDNLASRAFYERHGLTPGATRINVVNGMEQIEYLWRNWLSKSGAAQPPLRYADQPDSGELDT